MIRGSSAPVVWLYFPVSFGFMILYMGRHVVPSVRRKTVIENEASICTTTPTFVWCDRWSRDRAKNPTFVSIVKICGAMEKHVVLEGFSKTEKSWAFSPPVSSPPVASMVSSVCVSLA